MSALVESKAWAVPTNYTITFVNLVSGAPGGTPTGSFTYDPDIPAFSDFVVFWDGKTYDLTNNANCIPVCTTGSVAESFQLLAQTLPGGLPTIGDHYGYFWNSGIYSVVLAPNTSVFSFGVGSEYLYPYGGQFDNVSAYGTWSIAPTPSFSFTGFFPPVDNDPVLNNVKAGAAVPMKFSLNGDRGLNIFESGFPASQPIACPGDAILAPIEATAPAGQSGLQYDNALDVYTYVWKTAKEWSQTCRQFVIRLTDGSFHVANFQFR
jgi:hypothetical protein